MTFLGQKKPDLLELEHHGTKGMHWGVRKSRDESSPRTPKARKPTSREILDARGRTQARANRLSVLDDNVYLAKTEAGRAHAQKLLDKSANELLSHPDTKMAHKMTTGEKWLNGVAWGLFGTVSVASIALSAAGSRRL